MDLRLAEPSNDVSGRADDERGTSDERELGAALVVRVLVVELARARGTDSDARRSGAERRAGDGASEGAGEHLRLVVVGRVQWECGKRTSSNVDGTGRVGPGWKMRTGGTGPNSGLESEQGY